MTEVIEDNIVTSYFVILHSTLVDVALYSTLNVLYK